MTPRTVLVVTGSRAEYGAMRPVLRAIHADPRLALELAVTGMHLAPQFEASLAEILADGWPVTHRADMRIGGDGGAAMAASLGYGIIALAALMEQRRPAMVLLQGDRGEMLAAAIAAAHLNIPIVHMSGGDRSGTIDDSLRNAISKFAHVHLTTCAASSRRLVELGEDERRILEVGEPTLDVIKSMQFIPPEKLAQEFGLDLSRPIVLATQHPVTTEAAESGFQIGETLAALQDLGLQTVFTYPNTDAGRGAIVRALEAASAQSWLRVIPHLGQERYLSLMKIAGVLVGNSSSGILEAASFGLPVVNIGTRQHGRLRAENVVDVAHDRAAIVRAVQAAVSDPALRERARASRNPYGDGTAAAKTVAALTRLRTRPALIAKWIESSAPIFD